MTTVSDRQVSVSDPEEHLVKGTVKNLSDLVDALKAVLYDSKCGTFDNFMSILEQKTHMKREKLFYAFCGVVAVYLIIGTFAQLVCNFIGFAYPAYASVKAIRTLNREDDTHWLIYWTSFAAFSILDGIIQPITSLFPFYWLLKVVFLLYLYLPQTYGAMNVYTKVVDPAITKIDSVLSEYTSKTK